MIRQLAMMVSVVLFASAAFAQGPLPAYFVDPATELPWASCHVSQEGGSTRKIPFLNSSQLVPLSEVAKMNIGADPRTQVAYPVAGSVVGYLIQTYGLTRVIEVYRLEGRDESVKSRDDSWVRVFKSSLVDIERQWLDWLTKHFQ